jgi:RHS repeat-associated protein
MTYAYDAMGRRISKTVTSGTPTQYLYDGNNTVQETVGSTINPILVGLGIDERFARNDTTGRTYFLIDGLNSTPALTNSNGAIQNQYSYDPYGNASQSGTGFTNPYQYTGREANTAGLCYYRAQYYSPMMGGFISEDPIGVGGGQSSFYAYVGGDPMIYRDPGGKFIVEALVGAAVGGAFGILNGLLHGETASQIENDAIAAVLTGGVIGLTDGFALMDGYLCVVLRAGWSGS